jgi:hypothetical protein
LFGNTATGSDGGVYNKGYYDQHLTVANSILAGNSAPSNPDLGARGGTHTIRYSLIGNNSGTGLAAAPVEAPDANGNMIGTAESFIDAKLGPLANNGGPTLTRALLTGSPAIDAGDPNFDAAVYVDQRGLPFFRIVDGDNVVGRQIDMGAFEFKREPPELPGDYNLNGVVDAADYVAWRNTRLDSVTPFTGADGSGNGFVSHEDYDLWRANFGKTILPPGPALLGDYNQNGTVDAADYVVWRKTEGTNVVPFSGADGSGNGLIDEADRLVWRANFGKTLVVDTNTLTSTIAVSDPPVMSTADYRPLAEAAAIATPQSLSLAATVETNIAPVPLHDVNPVTRARIAGSRMARHVSKADSGSHEDALVAWLASQPIEMRLVTASAGWEPFQVNSKPPDRSDQVDDAIDLAFASLWGQLELRF